MVYKSFHYNINTNRPFSEVQNVSTLASRLNDTLLSHLELKSLMLGLLRFILQCDDPSIIDSCVFMFSSGLLQS